jgi:hypothetical protein
MFQAAPFELLADAAGSVTFGWADDRVYYARFSRSLSARLGETFASRLRAAAASVTSLKYFADARELESYDLLSRSAFVRAVGEQRRKFEQIDVLWWEGADWSDAVVAAIGEPLFVTRDPLTFESRLLTAAPRARTKLASKPESPHRSRWPLRR